MTLPRRPSRRIPSKSRGPRGFDARPSAAGSGPADVAPDAAAGGPTPGTTPQANPAPVVAGAAARPGSRAANRAAKRAVNPRPKARPRSGGRGSNAGLIVLGVVAIAIGAAVLLIGNPFGGPTPSASPGASASAAVVGDGTCPTIQPAALPTDETRTVTIKTEQGDIVIRIDGAKAPGAAGNFIALVACHFYDGSVFHRTPTLADGTPFVIQGGGPKPGAPGIGYTIQDEAVGTTYKRGTVAMARTNDRNSQSSQFFIVLDDKSAAPLVSANTYAIFGEVIDGMDVADEIYLASGGIELPSNPIVMTSVTVGPGPAATATPTPGTTATPTTDATTAPSVAASPAP